MNVFRGCKPTRVQVRGFAWSSSLRVGPESPSYVDVPRTIQPYLREKDRVKGTLPVPREIFSDRRPDKPSEEYIAAATPLPSKERKAESDDPHAEYNAWRYKMAEVRRKNLREGLLELYDRKQRTDNSIAKRGLEKQQRRDRILRQPEREDERLTRPSVIQAMLPRKTPVLLDPDREARLARSRAALKARATNERLERQDSLHTLYMNARNFITTEAQLNAEIEKVFPEGENEAWRNDHQYGENIWNLGMPRSVGSYANNPKRSSSARWDIIQDRVKKLGEEITGGKL